MSVARQIASVDPGDYVPTADERVIRKAVSRLNRNQLFRLVHRAIHALPPEAAGDRDAYAARVAAEWLPRLAGEGLCRFVDAYIDRSAFSVAQARPVLERARALGLGVRVHIGQFADVGGGQLAASLGRPSCRRHAPISSASRGAAASGRATLSPSSSSAAWPSAAP